MRKFGQGEKKEYIKEKDIIKKSLVIEEEIEHA